MLGLAEMVKYAQWQDAHKATQALQLTLANAVQRYAYYQTVAGPDQLPRSRAAFPRFDALDLGSLQNLNFSQTDPSSEPTHDAGTISAGHFPGFPVGQRWRDQDPEHHESKNWTSSS